MSNPNFLICKPRRGLDVRQFRPVSDGGPGGPAPPKKCVHLLINCIENVPIDMRAPKKNIVGPPKLFSSDTGLQFYASQRIIVSVENRKKRRKKRVSVFRHI